MNKKPIEPSIEKDVAEETAFSNMSIEELLSSVRRPQEPRAQIVNELMVREARGEIVSMDDLLLVLRHSHEGMMREKVFERVTARAHQLESHHLQICLKFCGGKVWKWADENRHFFHGGSKVTPQTPGFVPASAGVAV